MTSELSARPHSLIHVRNLQTHLPISVDAWGRKSKSQPVLISLSVSLHSPFSSAASQDAVEGSTIHYGILSKAVLSYCERVTKHHAAASKYGGDFTTVQDFARLLLVALTNSQDLQTPPTITWQLVDQATITVHLPKASLLGEGVKFVETTRGRAEGQFGFPRHAVLQLCNLKVPCIIGVNAHEREAKQVVIANVSLEGKLDVLQDKKEDFVNMERVVTSTIEASSFQTLEALCTCLTSAVIKDFLKSLVDAFAAKYDDDSEREKRLEQLQLPYLRIQLEKPTAVTFADAPCVEVLVDLDSKNEQVKHFWTD